MAPKAMPCAEPLKPGHARTLPTFEFQASLRMPQRAEHIAPLPALTSYHFTADPADVFLVRDARNFSSPICSLACYRQREEEQAQDVQRSRLKSDTAHPASDQGGGKTARRFPLDLGWPICYAIVEKQRFSNAYYGAHSAFRSCRQDSNAPFHLALCIAEIGSEKPGVCDPHGRREQGRSPGIVRRSWLI